MTELRPCSHVITAEMIRAYCDLTNDFNPIHIDPIFAAATPMGGVIAHGTLSLNLIWQMLEASFGPVGLVGALLDIRFTRPVRVNDVITTGGRVSGGTAGGLPPDNELFDIWAADQRGDTVIKGTFRRISPPI